MRLLSMLQVDTELSLMKQERIRLQKQVIFCDGILMADLIFCRLSLQISPFCRVGTVC
jgi:hypothetical protein